MSDRSAIIHYLRACYEADNRETTLFNVRSDRVQHLEFLSKGGDFLRGALDVVPVEREKALAAQKTAELYETERALIFGSIMIEARARAIRGETTVFAPLLLFPAEVELRDSHAVLKVDYQQQRVNTKVIAALLPDDAPDEALDEFVSKVPQSPFADTDLYDLATLIEDFLPSLNTAHLRAFNDPAKAPTAGASEPRVLWQHTMAVVPLSPESRGVLAELKALAAAPEHSRPIQALFGGEQHSMRHKPRPVFLASLSAAQEQALRSAATWPLTLLYGPPGTGKSFTAAVLALDQISRGGSVLVAARTNQALDAIQTKIETLLGASNLFLRGGSDRNNRPTELLDQWLREGPGKPAPPDLAKPRLAESIALLKKQQRALARREKWELALSATNRSLLHKLTQMYAEWRLRDTPSWMSRFEQLDSALGKAEEASRVWLLSELRSRLRRAVIHQRAHFRALRSALAARTTVRQNEHFSKIPRRTLFQGCPLWLTTLSAAYDILPLETEMFDLAIIDEATQCDMASALPILQRAKRVAVAGDPKQLRHISFLSRDRQKTLAAQFLGSDRTDVTEQFNYRDKSLLDLVLNHLHSHEQVVFLDEHFRSRPEIIAFSNKHFYEDKLKVMRRHELQFRPALDLVRIDGRRNAKRVNEEEASALLKMLAERIQSEESTSRPSTIGVLSPFRHQIEFLEKLLDQRFSLETIRRHRLRVGTSYSFQGDERDLMLISFALDSDSHPTAFRYLERRDVFNVAITRARNEQTVFYSFDPAVREQESLARQFLTQPPPRAELIPAKPRHPAISELSAELRKHGCTVNLSLPSPAGVLDLLASRKGKLLALVLCSHDHGSISVSSARVLHRCGLRIRPVSPRELDTHSARIVEEVIAALRD